MINSIIKPLFFVKVLSEYITRSKTEVVVRIKILKFNDLNFGEILKIIQKHHDCSSQAYAKDMAPNVFQPWRDGPSPVFAAESRNL